MSTVYSCPIPACQWTLADDGPEPPTHPITPQDAVALTDAHQSVIAAELGAHYETHAPPEWVMLVDRLRKELQTRTPPLLCVGCLSDRWQAEQQPQRGALPTMLPPLNPAFTIVEGNALCRAHLSFGAPQIPGRTPGGLILGDGTIPKTGL